MSATPSASLGRHRLVLTEGQSAFLREAGVRFAVIHPGSYPENPGRHVIDLIECDHKCARDALAVAMGEARAVKVKTPKATSTRAPAPAREPGLLAVPEKGGGPAE